MKCIFFDIETGPLPAAELAAMCPPFKAADVKLGNLKDPEKIAARIREAESTHLQDFRAKAALDALTGRVLAVGMMSQRGEFALIAHDDEADILREFWEACFNGRERNRMIGYNSRAFDLPFLIRRSYKHRVTVPCGIRRGCYWSDEMVDLREEWQLGDRQARGSLDAVARFLGVGRKNGHGAGFAELWQTDRLRAADYLKNDLEMTRRVAEVIGVVEPQISLAASSEPENMAVAR